MILVYSFGRPFDFDESANVTVGPSDRFRPIDGHYFVTAFGALPIPKRFGVSDVIPNLFSLSHKGLPPLARTG